MTEINYNKNPITFVDGLTLLFIGLKLTHYVNWSWIWVLCPEWITFIVGIIALICIKRKTKL